MDPSKVKVIKEWPTPRTRREVQSFLGFANFYCRFISEYSAIATPLNRLTGANAVFSWTPACQKAFDILKLAFVSAPILAHFQPEYRITLETDASDYAIGAILSQRNPETSELHPIAYHSRTMVCCEPYPISSFRCSLLDITNSSPTSFWQ